MAETSSSIIAEEVERFAALAGDWWDPNGASAMLHKLNPVRLGYIRDRIDHHWGTDECGRTPLKGRKAVDIGCGAGPQIIKTKTPSASGRPLACQERHDPVRLLPVYVPLSCLTPFG